MTAVMSSLTKAIVYSFLLMNIIQDASSFNIKRSAPDVEGEETISTDFSVLFHERDRDNSGDLSIDELLYPLSKDKPWIQRVFAVVDVNGNGTVDPTEYMPLAAMTLQYQDESYEQLKFRIIDVNEDGFVSKDEMFKELETHFDACGLKYSQLRQYVDDQFQFRDKDKDGKLNPEEANTLRGDPVSTLRLLFGVCDVDNDGFVNYTEMLKGMKASLAGHSFSDIWQQQAVDTIFAIANKDNNGTFSFEEFRSAIFRNTSPPESEGNVTDL